MMISLRHKLWLSFGSLLAVLLIGTGLSIAVLTRHSHTLERAFHGNYDSAIYCDEMKDALDRLNADALQLVWQPTSPVRFEASAEMSRFETNLQLQLRNSWLPGELENTRHLGDLWPQFKSRYAQLRDTEANRSSTYRDDVLPRFEEMKETAQKIADMNVEHISDLDVQVKHAMVDVRNALLVLAAAGVGLVALVVWAADSSVLNPLRTLTRSARQIEAGDLDLRLDVKSQDEIGQLSEAFNSMAARLRHFRELDHDRLVRTQQTTQLAIDSLPDAVFVIGADQRVEISNHTARAYFAIEPGADVGQLPLKWLMPLYQSVIQSRRPSDPNGYKSAIQLFEKGEERFLLPRAVPMLGKNADLIGVTVILVDVTRLRHVDEAKSNIISTVSHELRTPLTGIRMSLSLLASDSFGTVSPDQRRLITALREDSDRLHRIIENLLNISRMESGRSPLQLRSMSAGEIIAHSVDPLRQAFTDKQLQFELAAATDLPMLNADPVLIGSALTNLLTNAVKFTPAGGRVQVTAELRDRFVQFKVIDSGPGIPAQYRNRIFEKFFRIPRTDGPSGAGLGLAIAKDIVEAHGGRMGFDCPAAGGTDFTFDLPIDAP